MINVHTSVKKTYLSKGFTSNTTLLVNGQPVGTIWKYTVDTPTNSPLSSNHTLFKQQTMVDVQLFDISNANKITLQHMFDTNQPVIVELKKCVTAIKRITTHHTTVELCAKHAYITSHNLGNGIAHLTFKGV